MSDAPRALRSRLVPLAIVVVGLALFGLFGGGIPHDQTMRVVLGDAAPAVTTLSVRYRENDRAKPERAEPRGEWLREATFQYAKGAAPRVVTHEARLRDGDYVIEIDVLGDGKPATIERRVKLEGGTVSLDVSQAIPK